MDTKLKDITNRIKDCDRDIIVKRKKIEDLNTEIRILQDLRFNAEKEIKTHLFTDYGIDDSRLPK